MKTHTCEEFESLLFKTGKCWYWAGAQTKRGYGSLKFQRKTMYAHRVAWILYHGAIPDGLDVCHECDTPLCVRPDHLFLGTHADNMADMARKSRVNTTRGSKHRLSKLTEDKVRAILLDDRPQKVIAAEYGVSFGLISSIKKRRVWRHV